MAKRILLVILLAIGILAFSCLNTLPVVNIPTTASPIIETPTVEITIPEIKPPATTTTTTTPKPLLEVPGIEAKLADINWVSPSEVTVSNIYAGARAEWTIKVHNGGKAMSLFNVVYRIPDHTREGYDMPPLEANKWVTIAETKPMISARETREILVILAIPKDTVILSNNWEFWISVSEKSSDLVQTELAERWLISMRK